jgi:hypothetical protein
MTLGEMKKKVLRMIEEVNENNVKLTDDPDIAAKLNDVIQQVQIEVCRMKKIPALHTEAFDTFTILDLRTLPSFYQLENLRYLDAEGNEAEYNIFGTYVELPKPGSVNIFYNKYPERITSTTPDDYEFELSEDALEVLPYGVAADILKSDISNEYGKIYEQRYETMLSRLDPRYSMGSIYIEGGY